jgi:predicted DNA-binding protein
MKDQTDPITCPDDTKQITINLPCRLAERADKYARENGNTVTGVVIEALDKFLRERKAD